MTTKDLSHKQVIVPMNSDNIIKFMTNSSNHITNINRLLKNIKLKYKVDYIWSGKSGIIIVTDKVVSFLDLQTIERYVENVEVLQLSQSKSYLKIIGLPYLVENIDISLTLDVVKTILKNNYIFNNILIAS